MFQPIASRKATFKIRSINVRKTDTVLINALNTENSPQAIARDSQRYRLIINETRRRLGLEAVCV